MTNANLTLKIFGQSDCNPCRIIKAVIDGERPDIEELGVTIEHVDLTDSDAAEQVLIEKYGMDRKAIIAKYGIMSTPVTFIEKGSEIVTRFNGMFNMKELYETLEYAKTAK